MTLIHICLDAVLEHDPDRRLTRRIAGHPTPVDPGRRVAVPHR